MQCNAITLIVDSFWMMCTYCFILILIIHIWPPHHTFLPHVTHSLASAFLMMSLFRMVHIPHLWDSPKTNCQKYEPSVMSWAEFCVAKCCGCEHFVKCSNSQCWNYSLSMTFPEPQVITPHENTAMIVLQISLETPTTYILLSFFWSQKEAPDWLKTHRSTGCDWLVLSKTKIPSFVAMSHRAETRPSWPDVGVGLFLNYFTAVLLATRGGAMGLWRFLDLWVSARWECEIH